MSVQTVFVVEDEESFVDALTVGLKREGFRVEVARDGAEALERFDAANPDIVLLDVMLPKVSGIDVCRELRKRSQVPIIMVTAKSAEIDTVVGLEVGADDYLAKPFAMRELLARIRALLRRVEMMKPAAAQARQTLPAAVLAATEQEAGTEPPVVYGDLVIDRARRKATLGGATLTLRPKEFDLLHFLARNPDVVHSRDVLLRRVWGYDIPIDSRTVDVHVRWLRQKIDRAAGSSTRLETVRGVGYRLVSAGSGT
jgi:two-component system response regulator RegX3